MEKNMMLVSGNWGPYETFKLIPVNTDCPYVEAIFDPSGKILAVISTRPNIYSAINVSNLKTPTFFHCCKE